VLHEQAGATAAARCKKRVGWLTCRNGTHGVLAGGAGSVLMHWHRWHVIQERLVEGGVGYREVVHADCGMQDAGCGVFFGDAMGALSKHRYDGQQQQQQHHHHHHHQQQQQQQQQQQLQEEEEEEEEQGAV
jgi:hypothetical protein